MYTNMHIQIYKYIQIYIYIYTNIYIYVYIYIYIQKRPTCQAKLKNCDTTKQSVSGRLYIYKYIYIYNYIYEYIYTNIYIDIWRILGPVKPELGVIPSGQEIIRE